MIKRSGLFDNRLSFIRADIRLNAEEDCGWFSTRAIPLALAHPGFKPHSEQGPRTIPVITNRDEMAIRIFWYPWSEF